MLSIKVDLRQNVNYIDDSGSLMYEKDSLKNTLIDFIKNNTDETGKFKAYGQIRRNPGDWSINLSMVSHKITNIDLSTYIADIDIIDSIDGLILQEYIESGGGLAAKFVGTFETFKLGDGKYIRKICQITCIDLTKD